MDFEIGVNVFAGMTVRQYEENLFTKIVKVNGTEPEPDYVLKRGDKIVPYL